MYKFVQLLLNTLGGVSYHKHWTEAATGVVVSEKVFLEISQNSHFAETPVPETLF